MTVAQSQSQNHRTPPVVMLIMFVCLLEWRNMNTVVPGYGPLSLSCFSFFFFKNKILDLSFFTSHACFAFCQADEHFVFCHVNLLQLQFKTFRLTCRSFFTSHAWFSFYQVKLSTESSLYCYYSNMKLGTCSSRTS